MPLKVAATAVTEEGVLIRIATPEDSQLRPLQGAGQVSGPRSGVCPPGQRQCGGQGCCSRCHRQHHSGGNHGLLGDSKVQRVLDNLPFRNAPMGEPA
jgi:hypothetical protein